MLHNIAHNDNCVIIVCAVCNDGSIQMWDHRKNFVNVCLQVEKNI